MRSVKIGNQEVGDGYPAYIIAEVGINHNGDVALAKEMIAAAWESGADAVKIQTFITKDFLHPSHPGYRYDIDAQIPHKKEQQIWDFAKKKKINLFSTPEEFCSLEFIKRQKPKLIKIAAMDFNYKDLIQRAAAFKKPIILSSGMSTMAEVKQAIKWVRGAGNPNYIILHCTSCYPAKPQSCNLLAIKTMKAELKCPIGYSDHTEGTHIPLAAVALGANVIEKHFTIDKKLPGPDQKCSMDPLDLRALIKNIKDLEKAFGHGRKEPAFQEKEARCFKRRGIYAAKKLKKGTKLRQEDVLFFAPASKNSKVTDWPAMLGKRLEKDIPKMRLITPEDIF